jgi:LAO/AO transport system kinase
VDSFLLLSLARTGDSLQGIKKGVLELADVIAVNKADGPHATEAKSAARELAAALRLLRGAGWQPPVLTCSALEGTGIDTVWQHLLRHQDALAASGELDRRRRRQRVGWVRSLVRDALLEAYQRDPGVRALASGVEEAVAAGELSPASAAQRLLDVYTEGIGSKAPGNK